MKKYLSVILTLLMLIFFISPTYAFSAEKIDNDKKGSISVTIKSPDKKEPVSGAVLNFYRVADVALSNNKLNYTLAAGYKSSGATVKVDENGEFEKETPSVLYNYVQKNNIKGIAAKTNDEGTAFVGNCSLGLYLVTVSQFPEQITGSINPFLISIPAVDSDGALQYAVKASPKMSLTPSTTDDSTTDTKISTEPNSDLTSQPNDNNNTTNYSGNGTPDYNNGNKKPSQLPDTGMLEWPIPVLAFTGPLLFAFGYLDVKGKKKRNEK